MDYADCTCIFSIASKDKNYLAWCFVFYSNHIYDSVLMLYLWLVYMLIISEDNFDLLLSLDAKIQNFEVIFFILRCFMFYG